MFLYKSKFLQFYFISAKIYISEIYIKKIKCFTLKNKIFGLKNQDWFSVYLELLQEDYKKILHGAREAAKKVLF